MALKPSRPRSVLVVDPDGEARGRLARLLGQLGHQAVEAPTTQAALEVMRHGAVDAVLLAVPGPEPPGRAFVEQARRLRPGVPVVAVVERGDVRGAIEALDQGAEDVLMWPVTSDAMAVVLHRALRGPHPPAVAAPDDLEARLRHCQQLIVSGQLACGIAHDLNNLLTVVLGFNAVQLRQLDGRHPLRQPAEEVQRAANQAAALARRLLNLSRPQPDTLVPVNLNLLLRDMEKMLRHLLRQGIRLEMALDPALGNVRADPARLEQVLLNLVLNARDAMPRSGTLTLTTANRTVEPNMPINGLPAPGSYVLLSVSDTGTGIDPAALPRIFEPFFTTKPEGEGTGLGLAVVAEVVREYGGHVRVRSAPGQGATFALYFPRLPESAGAAGAEGPSSQRPTLLLVEDHPGVRALAGEVLRRQGYALLEAAGSEEALETCQNRPGPIDLLVADLNLPQGNGHELARLVRQLYPRVKVLYVSGEVPGDTAPEAGEAFLAKPFTPETLLRAVRALLENGDRAAGNDEGRYDP